MQNLVKTVGNVLNILDPTQDLEDDDLAELGMNAVFGKSYRSYIKSTRSY